MPGLKMKLTGANFNDASLPKISIDPVLPTAGAVLLIDPAHPVDPWGSGLPAVGGFVPNLAWQQAAAMIGSGDRLSLGMQRESSGTLTGSAGRLERSTKGGVHGIASQANMVSGAFERFIMSDLIRQYLIGYRSNLYVSMWWRSTRDNLAITSNIARVFSISRNNTDHGSVFRTIFYGMGNTQASSGVNTYPGNNILTQLVGNANERESTVVGAAGGVGWRRQSVTSSDWNVNGGKTMPTLASEIQARFGWGRSGTAIVGDSSTSSTLPADPAPSWIFQRLYIENLTVSGRSHAQVDALDQAEHIKHVRTSGGRYYGDTFVTNPTSVP